MPIVLGMVRRRASEDEDGVREAAFEFLAETFVEEQLNQELVEEGGGRSSCSWCGCTDWVG